MKKLKFWIAGVLFAFLVVVVTVNINLKYGVTDGRDLILTNIEALAQGEQGGNDCMGSGSVLCDGAYYKVRVSR